MEKKIDFRIQKTYMALIGALQAMLCEMPFEEITVTNLCERAHTRKATFYKHFGDKSELFVFMIKTIQDQYDIVVEKNGYENPLDYYTGIFKYMLDFFSDNEKMILNILKSSARWSLVDTLIDETSYEIKRLFVHDIKDGKMSQDISPEFLSSIYTGALYQGSCWWILNKNKMSKEEAVIQFKKIIGKLM